VYSRELASSQLRFIYLRDSAGKCLTPLYITSLNKSGNNVNLSWLAQKGVSYRAYSKSNLSGETSWTALSGDVTATNASASKSEVVPANAPQRVYRVELFQ